MGKKCVFSERGAFWNFQSATREFASQKETRLDADWLPAECVFFRCFNHIAQINPHQPDFQRREMISGRSGLICATWLKQRKKTHSAEMHFAPRRFSLSEMISPVADGEIRNGPRSENTHFLPPQAARHDACREKRARRLKLTLGDRKKTLVPEIHRK